MSHQERVCGCILRTQEPIVPSTEVVCGDCGVELWISNTMFENNPDITPLCMECTLLSMISDPSHSVSGLLPEQRDGLKRERGMTDAEIDEMEAHAMSIINKLVYGS